MEERANRKVKIGKVVSNKMTKTVVVLCERQFAHPIYKKIVKKKSKFKVHDEKQECQVGDRVRIAETRPLSREKCWRVVEILEKAK
jgi:small subunit ribosomal protein S17